MLSEFARTMVTDFPIQGILDHLVRRIVDILPITAAGVTLIAPGSSRDISRRLIRRRCAMRSCRRSWARGRAWRRMTPARRSRCLICASRSASLSSRRGRWTSGLAAVFTFPLRHEDAAAGGA